MSLKVHYFSTAEQKELLLQLLAMKVAAGALPPDEPVLEESGAVVLMHLLPADAPHQAAGILRLVLFGFPSAR
ncbi:hypothetical protein C0993_009312 [Termitomyces sp. T159_Od127]|nr:hypothetical protein C0993_009312 [Termitomyces sp. T159_Od127]